LVSKSLSIRQASVSTTILKLEYLALKRLRKRVEREEELARKIAAVANPSNGPTMAKQGGRLSRYTDISSAPVRIVPAWGVFNGQKAGFERRTCLDFP
jgi:hypothetical protein